MKLPKIWKYLSVCIIFVVLFASGMLFWNASRTDVHTKTVYIKYDGYTYPTTTTREFIGEVLSDEQIEVYPEDLIQPYITEHVADHQIIYIERATPITIVNFVGEAHPFRTRAKLVANLVQEIGFVPKEDDKVVPDPNTPITRDMTIRLVKYNTEQYTEELEIEFDTEYLSDATLEMPQEIVKQTGENGIVKKEFQFVYENGELKETKLLNTTTIKESITEIVIVGTKLPPSGTQIESGVASYYGDGFNGRLTASGRVFNNNELVCAHPSLPFGTKIKVTNSDNGKSIIVEVIDRGPYVSGRVIDLSKSAFEAIAPLSSGLARVTLDTAS